MAINNSIEKSISFNDATINLNTTINPGLPNSNGLYILELLPNTFNNSIVGTIVIQNLNLLAVTISIAINVITNPISNVFDIKERNYILWNKQILSNGEYIVSQTIFQPNTSILIMTNDNNIDVRLNGIIEI